MSRHFSRQSSYSYVSEDKPAIDCAECFSGCCPWLFPAKPPKPGSRTASKLLQETLGSGANGGVLGEAAVAEAEFKERISFLNEVPVFRRLPKSQYPLLARALHAKHWNSGDIVCKAGEETADFFLVAKGTASIELEEMGQEQERLFPGDYFGAKALEQGKASFSPVTIVAEQDLMTLELSAQEFEQYGLRQLLRFPGRAALGDPTLMKGRRRSSASGRKANGISEQDEVFLASALRANKNLRALADLNEANVLALCRSAERQRIPEGTTLVRRGDFSRMLYIVAEGRCELRLDSQKALAAEKLASVMLQRMQRKEEFLVHLDATPSEREQAQSEQQGAEVGFGMPPISEKGGLLQKGGLMLRSNSIESYNEEDSDEDDRPRRRESDSGLTYTPRGEPLADKPFAPVLTSPARRKSKPGTPKHCIRSEVFGGKALMRRLSRGGSRNNLPATGSADENGSDGLSPLAYDDQALDGLRNRSPMIRYAERQGGVLGIRVAGDSFGELSLLYNAPQASTVVSIEDTYVWAISQGSFRKIMQGRGEGKQEKQEEVLSYLDGVDILHGLWAGEKRELIQNLQFQSFQAEDLVVQEGETLKMWFIVVTGELTCYRTVNGQQEVLVRLGPCMHLGERSLLKQKPSEFSVRVTSAAGARCLSMDSWNFLELARFLRGEPLLQSAQEDALTTFVAKKEGTPLHHISPSGRHVNRPKINITSLTRIGILGSGAFGLVTLDKDDKTGQKIAVKALSKGHIVSTSSQEHVKRERELLLLMDSPFIVRLLATSQDAENIYFYMDPALGGDLRTLHHRRPELFSDNKLVVPFMVCCLSAALGHIHERAIVFRDLKPENVLLNTEGIAQLCDFGFARLLLGKARTLVGTPEYLAPEVVKHQGYDRMVDWWALGVLTYELLAGVPPFGEADEDPAGVHGVFRNVVKGIKSVEFPFSDSLAISFIKRSLDADLSKRLGKKGPFEVACQPYTKCIDYGQLLRGEVASPYIPETSDDLDCFDEDVDLPPTVPYKDDGSGWDTDF